MRNSLSTPGHTYERSAIGRWFKTSNKSPLTGAVLTHTELVSNYMLLSSIQEASSRTNVTPAHAAAVSGLPEEEIITFENDLHFKENDSTQ
jgi:hypothetical protein